ncbi:MAG: ABC transporter ATP-binding protein [Vicinamibacterales bacterium]
MTTPLLSLRNIIVERAGRVILDVARLDLFPRDLLAVVGPNGAGKSTLIGVMGLLDRPTRGEVMFGRATVAGSLVAHRRRMAVVFQDALLLDTTTEANVASGLALRGVPRDERARRTNHWLEKFGISDLARRSARTLSGGEGQRASLARAFAVEPEIMLLDEPFASLDAPTRATLIDDLAAVLAETGTTTVFVTHDRAEALRLGDSIAVLMNGRIRQTGSPSHVFAHPADEEVAGFVGIETITPGRVASVNDGLAIVAVGERTVEAVTEQSKGSEVLVCLRPEDVTLSRVDDGNISGSARNRLAAVVRRVVPAGPYIRVELDCGFELVALITKPSLEDLELAPGSPVIASFKATAVHLIPHHARVPVTT